MVKDGYTLPRPLLSLGEASRDREDLVSLEELVSLEKLDCRLILDRFGQCWNEKAGCESRVAEPELR